MREGRDVIHAKQVPFTARKRTFVELLQGLSSYLSTCICHVHHFISRILTGMDMLGKNAKDVYSR
jgi:hypothetical protein